MYLKFSVDKSKKVPIYRQLADTIRGEIIGGRLPLGTQLPTVRELAKRFDLAQGTIKRAYDELENLGMIEMTQGRGTFVSFRREHNSRKARAMQAIDALLDTLEDMSFSQNEISIFFELKLRDRMSRGSDIHIAAVGTCSDMLYAVSEQLYSFGDVDVFRCLYDGASSGLFGDADLVVYLAETAFDTKTSAGSVRIAMRTDGATVSAIARTGENKTAGVLAVGDEMLDVMMKSFAEYAPDVAVRGKTLRSISDMAALERFLENKDVICVPMGFMTLFSPEVCGKIFESCKSRELIQYKYVIDDGSMMYIQAALDDVRAKKRLGIMR